MEKVEPMNSSVSMETVLGINKFLWTALDTLDLFL